MSDDIFGGFALSSDDNLRLQHQRELAEFGFWGKTLFTEVEEMLTQDEAFGVPPRVLELNKFLQEERDFLLAPHATQKFKLPSMTDLIPGAGGEKFEKPLFDRAKTIRNTLLPVAAICTLLAKGSEATDEEYALTGRIAFALKNKLVEELRNLNLARIAAKLPDETARRALMAKQDSVLRSETAMEAVENAKKVKKLADALKPKPRTHQKPVAWQRRGGRPNNDAPPSTPSSSSSSSAAPPTAAPSSSPSQPPSAEGGGRRGRPRGGYRGRGTG